METLISFADAVAFDIQVDNDLEAGRTAFSDGPDRAYLYLPYKLTPEQVRPNGGSGAELLALWLIDSPTAAETLAAGLGAPLPKGSQARPFELTWIRDGQLAVKRRAISADAAVWLINSLAPQDQLDQSAHLFWGHGVDKG